MKFMFFSEAETLPGASYQTRYWELVEQVIHAEKWGFDVFGVSEQQYAIGGIATSCPRCCSAYLFPLTKTLRFAHAITLLPRQDEPRPAHRLAHRGAGYSVERADRAWRRPRQYHACTARLRGRSREEPRRSQRGHPGPQEGVHRGPLHVLWRALQDSRRARWYRSRCRSPHPPIYLAATSAESHKMAGDLGVGVYSWSNFMGWDALAESVAAFRKASDETSARGEHVNRQRRRAAPGLLRRNRRDRGSQRPAAATSNGCASPSMAIRGWRRWRRAMPT